MTFSKHSRQIALSFSIVLGLLLVMILFSLSRMSIMQDNLDVIVKEHRVKTKLMMDMQHGIYDRQISLRTLLLMDDPFDRDEEKLVFNSFALNIVAARDKFTAMALNAAEKEILDDIRKSMVLAYTAQINLIDKSIYNEDEVISEDEIRAAFLTQEDFSKKIQKMVRFQTNETKKAVLDAGMSYREAKQSIYILGGTALLMGVFITFFIIRLTESKNKDINNAMIKLEESHEKLEERVKKRTEQLAFARDQALASNKAKDMFLANMSHELRTPLNIIVGYSEMLEEMAEDKEDEDFIPDLKKIQSAADHQLQLINSLLDISKIEEGMLELYPVKFDLQTLIKDIDAATKPLMKKNNNKFEINFKNELGNMYSDNLRLRQILLNLLSNAAKFTTDGEVSLNITKVNNEQDIVFEIKDTGIGIPEDYVNELFDKFTQEDSSTTRKYGGTGLGLSISKQLAILLQGDIVVDSIKGKGSTFFLTLPVRYSVNKG